MLESITKFFKDRYKSVKTLLPITIILSVVLVIVDVVLDLFLPDQWYANYVRSVAAILTAIPMFSFGYVIVLRQHDGQVAKAIEAGEEYLELRLRYSSRRRFQHSVIAGSVLALLAIVTSYTKIYTATASVILAAVFGLILYCRLTEDEKVLRKYDVPDPRDVLDDRIASERKIEEEASIELKKDELREKSGKTEDEDDSEDNDDDKKPSSPWTL
jgi:hypothetical protein